MFNGVEALKKMTRETKVGLVVAGSFLCLVVVVLFFKLRDGGSSSDVEVPVVFNEPGEEQPKTGAPEAGAHAQAGSIETNPPSPPRSAGGTDVSSPLDNGGASGSTLLPVTTPPLQPPPPSDLPATIVQTSGNPTETINSGDVLGGNPGASQPSAVMPPQGTELGSGNAAPGQGGPSGENRSAGAGADAVRRDGAREAMPPPTPVEEKTGQGSGGNGLGEQPLPPPTSEGLGGAGTTGQTGTITTVPSVDAAGTGQDGRNGLGGSTGVTPPPAPVAPPPLDPVNERPVTALQTSGEPATAPGTVDPRVDSVPPPADGRAAAAATLSGPVPADSRPAGLGTPGAGSPANDAGQLQPASAIPPAGGAVPSVTGVNVQPSPGTTDRGVGLNGDARAPLPAGTPVGASAPPITIPASRGPARPAVAAPQVESYDEEEYRVKAGDTFQAISMQFYRTDRYAPALLLYNRSHPLGSLGVRQEPPVLQAGQPVFIPPTNILEKRHSAAVPDLTPLTPGRVAPVPERRSNASPSAAAGGALPYRVQGEGEMMWEIARRTLHNGERWQEIHKLNPSLRPELRVAGGTVVNLPPDAQVDAAPR